MQCTRYVEQSGDDRDKRAGPTVRGQQAGRTGPKPTDHHDGLECAQLVPRRSVGRIWHPRPRGHSSSGDGMRAAEPAKPAGGASPWAGEFRSNDGAAGVCGAYTAVSFAKQLPLFLHRAKRVATATGAHHRRVWSAAPRVVRVDLGLAPGDQRAASDRPGWAYNDGLRTWLGRR